MTESHKDNTMPQPWSGTALLEMFSSAARILESHVDIVNSLNVFPVQDGDTGINMLLTLRDTLAAAYAAEGNTAEDVARAMWSGARMGAKGNGGSIVSQLFKGMSEAFDGKTEVTATDFAAALWLARAHAYKAIGTPVEGTMLTVFTHAAVAAAQASEVSCSADDLLASTSQAARDAVILTPTLLPRLREAGVVDSGGLGLWMILEGVRRHAIGDDSAPDDLDLPLPDGLDLANVGVSLDFLDMTEDEEYGSCTQFVMQGERLSIDAVRAEISVRGQSAVVIGDDELIRVHVHTEEPDEMLDYARTLGSVSRISVENMDDQRARLATRQREQADTHSEVIPLPILAVAWGGGLESVFHAEGVSVMVAGDTMNPSVRDILDAMDGVPSEYVIILPNNGNIVAAAQQAAEITDKTALVVPTRNIPQGIAAVLRFQSDRSIADNAADMLEEIALVRTAEVTHASRTVTLDGVTAEEGQLIGLFERRMLVAGKGLIDTVLAILDDADVADGELVTLYSGEPVTQSDAEEVVAAVQSAYPLLDDVHHIYGGQPYYHFIISIE